MKSAVLTRLALLAPALAFAIPSVAPAQSSPPPRTAAVARTVTLQELIANALEANLEIQAKRFDPTIQEQRVSAAWGAFDPIFNLGALHEEAERAQNQVQFLSTGQVSRIFQEYNDRYQASLGGRLPTGTTYELLVDHARLNNTSNRSTTSLVLFRPEYQSTAVLRVTQPLLRDAGLNANLTEVRLSKNAQRVSEHEFRATVMRVIAQTMAAYFEAVFAQENVRVKQQAIDLAESLLHENRRRVEEGNMSPIDVIQAQARVAEAMEELILAENFLAQRRNTLTELTKAEFDFDAPTIGFDTRGMQLTVPVVERDDLLVSVFERNPSYLAAVESAEAEDIRVAYAKNQRWPRVDLRATYGYNGLGRDFKYSFHDFEERGQADWSAGVVVSIPLGNRTARARLSEAKIRKAQAALNLKRSEVALLSAVDTALRDIKSSQERVDLVKDSVTLAESALDAELKRLSSGLTTSYNVLALQKELSQARSRELATLVDLNKAITTLHLVEGGLAEKMNVVIKTDVDVPVRPLFRLTVGNKNKS